MNENTSTTHSHARKHLGLAYLCGGCYGKIYKRPQALYMHRQSCQPTVVRRKEKTLSEEICLQLFDENSIESSWNDLQPQS